MDVDALSSHTSVHWEHNSPIHRHAYRRELEHFLYILVQLNQEPERSTLHTHPKHNRRVNTTMNISVPVTHRVVVKPYPWLRGNRNPLIYCSSVFNTEQPAAGAPHNLCAYPRIFPSSGSSFFPHFIDSATAPMDFSSTHAALRSLKRRSTTSDSLRILAEKLEGPFAGKCFCLQVDVRQSRVWPKRATEGWICCDGRLLGRTTASSLSVRAAASVPSR